MNRYVIIIDTEDHHLAEAVIVGASKAIAASPQSNIPVTTVQAYAFGPDGSMRLGPGPGDIDMVGFDLENIYTWDNGRNE